MQSSYMMTLQCHYILEMSQNFPAQLFYGYLKALILHSQYYFTKENYGDHCSVILVSL